MKKRLISFLLIIVLSLFVLPLSVQAAGTLSNFSKTNTYKEGLFKDVPKTEWYADDVQLAYEYGLVNGTTPTTYSPGKNLSLAEAIKFAACLNEIYNTGVLTLKNGETIWYETYTDYALSHDIIQAPYADYTAYATRADMAVIFAAALPDEALPPINTIEDNSIPDVPVSKTYSTAIYKLYNAGILSGIDSAHTYKPDAYITRAEVAAIVTRMANTNVRVFFSIATGGSTGGSAGGASGTVYSISTAPSAVTVAKDSQIIVNCTASSRDFDRLIPVISNPAVVSCTWGIPSGTTFPLTIVGLSAGTAVITVRLLDAEAQTLAESNINVTVTGGSAVTVTGYFPGYYPVLDYGIYVGVAPYEIDYDTTNGSTFYAYRVSAIAHDMTYAVNGYLSLLEENGFIFSYRFYDDEDNEIQVFSNAAYRLRVFFTKITRNGIPSIVVKATPY